MAYCRKAVALVLVAGFLLSCPAAHAQELEPRSYTNVPVGETFLVLVYGRSSGDIAPSGPSSPIQELELTIDAGVVGFAHTFELGGSSAKLDMSASRLCFEGSAIYEGEFVEAQRCGYGDPRFKLTWNFYGAPAMELKEFSQWEPGLVMGASLQVSVPVGTYDNEKLINFGANRWMLRPGLGISYKMSRWYFDIMTSVRLYQDNDDFFGGFKVEQKPLYSVQGHVIYTLGKGRWLSVDANFYRGGETTVADAAANDWKENSRWGLTYSTPINPHHSLKFYVSTGVVTRAGDDFDSFGIGWLYRF